MFESLFPEFWSINKLLKFYCLLIILLACDENTDGRQLSTPLQKPELPPKEDVWIFMMAGQSNMAGRGAIEAQDRILNNRILTINSENKVIVAKQPIHFYEPSRAGLDCGLSFGTEMLKKVPDNVSILLVPTAVGASSISQWITDETHRGVTLFSNFSKRLKVSLKHGIMKGILWHQGESDAAEPKIQAYQGNLKILFDRFRKVAGNKSLPIVMGKLGSFYPMQENWDMINAAIEAYATSDEFCEVIETSDLEHKGDRVHFNAVAQRTMGKRYAEIMLKLIN